MTGRATTGFWSEHLANYPPETRVEFIGGAIVLTDPATGEPAQQVDSPCGHWRDHVRLIPTGQVEIGDAFGLKGLERVEVRWVCPDCLRVADGEVWREVNHIERSTKE